MASAHTIVTLSALSLLSVSTQHKFTESKKKNEKDYQWPQV